MPKARESYGPGGVLGEIYGPYENRIVEYRLAANVAFDRGLLRINSPVLDIGCRDPYQGMLRFLREFGWDDMRASRWLATPYVGIDLEFDEEVLRRAQEDPYVHLIQADLDEVDLSSGTTKKPYAVAFCLEVLEHLKDPARLLQQVQAVAATIFLVGPNKDFQGYYHEVPGHQEPLSAEGLRGWGFQDVGYANFNGQTRKGGAYYPWDNGQPGTSSEVWGVWRDPRAEAMVTGPHPRGEASIGNVVSGRELLAMRGLLSKAGHHLEAPEVRSGR